MVKPRVFQQVKVMDSDIQLQLQRAYVPRRVPLLALFVSQGSLKQSFLFSCVGEGSRSSSHTLCVALRHWAVAHSVAAFKASWRQTGIRRAEGWVVVRWSQGQVALLHFPP